MRAITAAAILVATMSGAANASTLENVTKRGTLKCSSSVGTPGFAIPDKSGKYVGLDIDFCRAIASAIFGDPDKISIVPLSPAARFTALQTGEVDVLFNTTTWTLGREATNGILFAGVNYYDGQGIMVRSGEVQSAKELNGATICTNQGSTTELNLTDFFRINKLKNEIVAYSSQEEAAQAYQAGRCDAFSSDRSVLYAFRTKLTEPEKHTILNETLSKEPLGLAVRQGDDQWYNIVKWAAHALHAAEEFGLTSANIAETASTTANPNILRLIGKEGKLGDALGLPNEWAYNIVLKVGSYAEVFERNIGKDSPLKIKRGINASWKDGGLHYAPPIR
ncbi:amino acid ABC transporter substrate-binding protein [Bosea sp. (in: a-proteobacteria)]|uniref:amino acid ABC transporter substrate-binding protein n=1 Tax=Bosea sp. (in: a-proteobacteria) TaxID=1871050 RepID=UPI00086A2CAD|nr:amino acid ABC transporter substrate-binding protein [Bosea sp. (in: a-proteobacteria)]MBN9436742.1 amino acid ABC transporter substrate-binding protein [Bosea sp. (in: a-proteobacteria)]MBN9468817.1 amino acid ABC transporter substrate-binding protein [Bosea sp. (in: a-proteobacteria)]ODT43538.1 MAG: amino acid ABC transporter substrate-binding protein [Methylobacterium sp. SCN 67-24]